MNPTTKKLNAHPVRALKRDVMRNTPRRESGIPIQAKHTQASIAPSRYAIVSDADVKKRGVMRMLENLNADMAKLEKGVHEERRCLIASAYEVAKCLKTDKSAMAAFCKDDFWTGDLPRPKLNGKDLLRFVLIRVRGNTVEHRSTASRWAKPLKAAFDAGKPSQAVPELLIKAAKRVTKEKKTKATTVSGSTIPEATSHTTDLGKISRRDVFYGFAKRGKTVIKYDALDGFDIIIAFVPNKGSITVPVERVPPFDIQAFRAAMAGKASRALND